jgi:hypothetical protein
MGLKCSLTNLFMISVQYGLLTFGVAFSFAAVLPSLGRGAWDCVVAGRGLFALLMQKPLPPPSQGRESHRALRF